MIPLSPHDESTSLPVLKAKAMRAYDDAKRNADAALARREAIRRGDVQLPEHEPITLAPLPACVSCDDPISYLNASPEKDVCLHCHDGKNGKPLPIAWGTVAKWLVVGGLAMVGAGQLIGKLAWWMGGGQ